MTKAALLYPFLAAVGFLSGVVVGYYNSFPIPELRQYFGQPRPEPPPPLFAGPVFDYLEQASDVVMVGDSITHLVQWNEVLDRRVANRGVSGQTSAEVLSRIDEVVAMNPSVVFLMVGINDINRGHKLTELVDNVHKIVQALRGTRVVVQSVLHVRGDSQVNRLCDLVNTRIARICVEEGVEFLDVNGRIAAEDGWPEEHFLPDGVHLSGAGINAWVKVVKATLMGK